MFHYDIPFTAPADATTATVQVVWPEPGGNQSVALVLPDGTTIPQSQFSPANGFSVLPQLTTGRAIAVGAVNPAGPYVPLAPGGYTLRLVSNRRFGTAPKLTASFGHAPPTVAVAAPPAFLSGPVAVSASGKVSTALGANARATFFYDGDGSGYHGTAIDGARNLPVTVDANGNWTASGVWAVDGLLPLPYSVYARIDDGVNGPVYSAYSAAVTPTPALSGTVSTNNQALSGIRVYLDADDNGRYDAGADPSTTTGPTGFYAFTASELPPAGPVFVGVIVPSGFRLHPESANPVSVTYNGDPLVVNFELDQFTSIQGQVYNDLPAGRVGLSGWTVYLDADGDGRRGADEVATLTNSTGRYAFRNVPLDSTQTVRVEVQDGFFQTAPAEPGTYTVEVGPEQFRVYGENDFGVLPLSTISGTITGHLLKDGVPDPHTVPLEGFAVRLLQNGTTVAITTTDANGNYSFPNLRPGTYAVEQVVPTGYRQVTPAGTTVDFQPEPLSFPSGLPGVIAVADFDGNGRPDFAVNEASQGEGSGGVMVYYNGDFDNPDDVGADVIAVDIAVGVAGRYPYLLLLDNEGNVTTLTNPGGHLLPGTREFILPSTTETQVYEHVASGTFAGGSTGDVQGVATWRDPGNPQDGSGIVYFRAGAVSADVFTAPGSGSASSYNAGVADINGDGLTDLFLGQLAGAPRSCTTAPMRAAASGTPR